MKPTLNEADIELIANKIVDLFTKHPYFQVQLREPLQRQPEDQPWFNETVWTRAQAMEYLGVKNARFAVIKKNIA